MVENLVGKLWNSYKRLDMTRKRLFQNGSNWGWNGLKMASELSPSQNQVKTESRLSQLGSTQIDRLESEPSARVWLRLAGVDSGRLGRANDINILEPAKGGSTKFIGWKPRKRLRSESFAPLLILTIWWCRWTRWEVGGLLMSARSTLSRWVDMVARQAAMAWSGLIRIWSSVDEI